MTPFRSTLGFLVCASVALTGCESNAEDRAQKTVNDRSTVNQDVKEYQQVQEQSLEPFSNESANLCGYKDAQGKVVVKAVYDTCGIMSDGMAYVGTFLDDMAEQYKIGYINYLGKVVIPLENKVNNDWEFDVRDFNEGLAAQNKDSKWGYINKEGEVVINYIYDSAQDFDGGVAVASIDDKGFGLINSTGEAVVPFKYADISEFSNGFGMAKDRKTNKYGVIDKSGKLHGGWAWDDAVRFSEGLAAVATGTGESAKWGFVDEAGVVVIKPAYDMVHVDMGGDSVDSAGGLFQNGVVDVYKETSNSFTVFTIDKTGKQLSKKTYDDMASALVN